MPHLNILEIIVILVVTMSLIIMFVFYGGLEEKYIKKLRDFSDKHGFVEKSTFFEDEDFVKYHSVYKNKIHLYYLRAEEMSSDYYYRSEVDKMTASIEYRSHWIVLKIHNIAEHRNVIYQNKVKDLASKFPWTFIETQREGVVNIDYNADILTVSISPPLYSSSLSNRILKLLEEILTVK